MILTFDVEASGLDVHKDRVWCVCAKNFETGEAYEFRPNQLHEFKTLCDRAKKLVAHNGIQYDVPILRNNGIVDIPHEKVVDTLVLSRLYYPDRDGHGVEAWGKRLGWPKVEHEDWSEFSEDMLHRCREDVNIQDQIYRELLKEKGDWDWELAEKLEHKVQQILFEQEKNGWQFRVGDAKSLVSWLEGEMERLEQEMDFGVYYEKKGEVTKPFKKDGSYTKQVEDWIDGGQRGEDHIYISGSSFHSPSGSSDNSECKLPRAEVGGPFGRIEWHRVGLSQKGRVKEALLKMGWKPTSYTEKGSPQLSPNGEVCPNLKRMGGVGEKLAHYSLCAHRRGQIQGWMDNVREDGRVPSIAIGCSTNTGRMAHRIIANVPKASEKVFLGPEMRDMFAHKEGYTLVGWDAEGLELRVLAHYMNDPEFTEAVVNGDKSNKTDIHNVMLRASDGIIPDRDTEKNCIYCIIYGGGDWKLGQTAGYSKDAKKMGKQLRAKWSKRFPKLEKLVTQVSKAAERGYLIGIDGRKIWMRRDPSGKVMAHKGLNTLIQCTGSVIVKTAVCYLTHYAKSANLDYTQLIVYHDEVVSEVNPKDVDTYKKLCYKAMKETEKRYNFKCPLGIEVAEGSSWRVVH